MKAGALSSSSRPFPPITTARAPHGRFCFSEESILKQPIADNDNSTRPATVFLLMAQYHGKAVISVDEVCRDYFPHLDSTKFIRKVGAGDIAIPMIRMEASQKTAKGVHINDLAEYIDRQAHAARKECRQLACA
jgi:hypothetical protein